MDELTALFSRKDMTFEEAVAYFKERVPVTASRFYQIAAEYRALAFTVSGYTKAQVLKKFYDELLAALGLERQNFFMMPSAFRPLYIGSGVWQGIGYSSIIYLAAIAGINPEMYESAVLDGAGRVKQMWYITLPSILPTISILFILAVAGILGNDYQKILLMYSPRTYSTADVVNTYVYRYGIETAGNHLSYSSSVGLLVNVVSLVFLIIANTVTGRLSETSLF